MQERKMHSFILYSTGIYFYTRKYRSYTRNLRKAVVILKVKKTLGDGYLSLFLSLYLYLHLPLSLTHIHSFMAFSIQTIRKNIAPTVVARLQNHS